MKAIVQPARWVNATYVRRVEGVDKVADDRVEARIGALGTRLRSHFSQRFGWSGITLTLPTDA
jgi:hypothetical protein